MVVSWLECTSILFVLVKFQRCTVNICWCRYFLRYWSLCFWVGLVCLSYVTQIFINIFSFMFFAKEKGVRSLIYYDIVQWAMPSLCVKKGVGTWQAISWNGQRTDRNFAICSMAAGILEQHETTDDWVRISIRGIGKCRRSCLPLFNYHSL